MQLKIRHTFMGWNKICATNNDNAVFDFQNQCVRDGLQIIDSKFLCLGYAYDGHMHTCIHIVRTDRPGYRRFSDMLSRVLAPEAGLEFRSPDPAKNAEMNLWYQVPLGTLILSGKYPGFARLARDRKGILSPTRGVPSQCCQTRAHSNEILALA